MISHLANKSEALVNPTSDQGNPQGFIFFYNFISIINVLIFCSIIF